MPGGSSLWLKPKKCFVCKSASPSDWLWFMPHGFSNPSPQWLLSFHSFLRSASLCEYWPRNYLLGCWSKTVMYTRIQWFYGIGLLPNTSCLQSPSNIWCPEKVAVGIRFDIFLFCCFRVKGTSGLNGKTKTKWYYAKKDFRCLISITKSMIQRM